MKTTKSLILLLALLAVGLVGAGCSDEANMLAPTTDETISVS